MPDNRLMKFHRWRIPLTALLLLVVYVLIYPYRINLSGDQTAQVVAAESLVRDGTYKVSLHESYGPGVTVNIGDDLRQPLRWFPAGYSVVLFLLAKLGLSLAGAALLVHYAAKFVWAACWLAAGSALDIPYRVITASVAFLFFLTYPSTTTDLFESIATALLFIAISQRLKEYPSAALASLAVAGGIVFRYAAFKLIGFYGLMECLRRPNKRTILKVALAAVPPVAVYLIFTRLIGGDSTPYHRAGPAPFTNWTLLGKGAYYAASGGWSPNNPLLKVLVAVLLALAGAGLYRLYRKGSLPQWIAMLGWLQMFCMLFLIVVQMVYGNMYSAEQPAFATPRFFTLAQPLSVAALLTLAPFGVPDFPFPLRHIAAAALVLCIGDWVIRNHAILDAQVVGVDGFRRAADLGEIHRLIQSERPDAIFNGVSVFLYTAADPRTIYPDSIAAFRAPRACRIAVVRYSVARNYFLEQLEKRIAPYKEKQIATFDISFFQVPSGFELTLAPDAVQKM